MSCFRESAHFCETCGDYVTDRPGVLNTAFGRRHADLRECVEALTERIKELERAQS